MENGLTDQPLQVSSAQHFSAQACAVPFPTYPCHVDGPANSLPTIGSWLEDGHESDAMADVAIQHRSSCICLALAGVPVQ